MEKQVYVRHSCRTKYLAHVNTLLTDVQKTLIQTTPFAWLLSIDVDAKMSRTLLLELCSRWSERRGGFEVRSVFIPFTKLDLCLGLGVRVNGEMFKLFKDEVDCHTRRLFDTIDVSVHNVYEEIQKHIKGDEVSDVCRLYLLLGLSEFFFPNRGGKVPLGLFELLDDLSCIGKYNWGRVIYEYLVSSLCDVALCVGKRQNRSHCHVVGCVFALQIWAMEHVLYGQKKLAKTNSCLPRILHWIHVKVGEAEIEKAFLCNEVITEIYVSNEEMCTEIVKEGLDGHHNAGLKENLQRRSMADIVAENEALVAIIVDQEASIGKLEKMVDNLAMVVAQKRQQFDDVTNSNSNKKCDMLVHEFGTSSSQEHYEVEVSSIGKSNSKKESEIEGDRVDKSNSENVFDVTPAVGKSFIENDGDVLGHAEMDTEKSDIYTRLKAQPRKCVRSVLLKTPWTRLDRKNHRRIV
ncbi:uncharacterized protein LOC128193765 [Vigna angularis]|uniref:uncharacterized protein LOC128193765 n=1 Tax=Phaseolus angularis TaxID=3914 RepID=UPI0022B3F38A|nr:uncharacterized protein LOC128193765 [Vigna angularis]